MRSTDRGDAGFAAPIFRPGAPDGAQSGETILALTRPRCGRVSLDVMHRSLKVFILNLMAKGFEPEVAFMRNIIRCGDICIHAGASDGRHTLVMARLASKGGVYAFEPSEETFPVLLNMIFLHRLRNVEAWNVALADKPGRLKLLTPVKLNKIRGRSFACISDLDGAFRREDVGFLDVLEQQTDCLTIDDFCEAKRLARVDFLRCDVEGAEEKVLNGARRSIERHLPSILIEIHPIALRTAFDTTAEHVRDSLLSLGYEMFRVENGDIVRSREILAGTWSDYFFLHPERRAHFSGPFRDLIDEVPEHHRKTER